MNAGLIGLYAIYLILIGIKGNASKAYGFVNEDGKGFLTWIIAIIVLRSLYNSKTLRPVVAPFIGLAVLSFVLMNYGKIIGQLNKITGLTLPGTRK